MLEKVEKSIGGVSETGRRQGFRQQRASTAGSNYTLPRSFYPASHVHPTPFQQSFTPSQPAPANNSCRAHCIPAGMASLNHKRVLSILAADVHQHQSWKPHAHRKRT